MRFSGFALWPVPCDWAAKWLNMAEDKRAWGQSNVWRFLPRLGKSLRNHGEERFFCRPNPRLWAHSHCIDGMLLHVFLKGAAVLRLLTSALAYFYMNPGMISSFFASNIVFHKCLLSWVTIPPCFPDMIEISAKGTEKSDLMPVSFYNLLRL